VASTLEVLRRTIRRSNEIGSENCPLGPIQRKMLLAMIEAMLVELTQPYVEEGRVRGFFKSLGDIFKRGAKDALAKEVSDAVGATISAGKDFITGLTTSSAVDNLSNLPPDSWSV
jgi:hypothetical protein